MRPLTPADRERLCALAINTAMRWAEPADPAIDRTDMAAMAVEGVLRSLHTYDPSRGATLRTWAINKARWAIQNGLRDLDHIGPRGRKKLAPDDPRRHHPRPFSDLAPWEEPALPGPSADALGLRLALDDAIARLEPREQRVVLCHLLHDLPLRRVSEYLGLSFKSCLRIWREARAKLQDALAEEPRCAE